VSLGEGRNDMRRELQMYTESHFGFLVICRVFVMVLLVKYWMNHEIDAGKSHVVTLIIMGESTLSDASRDWQWACSSSQHGAMLDMEMSTEFTAAPYS